VTSVRVGKAYTEFSSECLKLAGDTLCSAPQDTPMRKSRLVHDAPPVEVPRNNGGAFARPQTFNSIDVFLAPRLALCVCIEKDSRHQPEIDCE
jgi:hypothetical protein